MSETVGILGATGAIGEIYRSLLHNHPWFELTTLAASDRSVGQKIDSLEIRSLDAVLEEPRCAWIFSALPNALASRYDSRFAARGLRVISSASCHRSDPDIPVVIPEINPHHLDRLPDGGGFIVAKPNCSIQSFLLPLAPLHEKFTLTRLSVTTLQALSGAGKSFPPLEGNVLPFIAAEEEKLETEPLKILDDPTIKISAHCTRVPVQNGHIACVSAEFLHPPTREEILELWKRPSPLSLPSAPKFPIRYLNETDRPQPALDCGASMCVSVGRLRPCSLFHWRFCALSHNLVRGGAGGGLLIAELLYQRMQANLEAVR